ncbi:MAG TPA: Ig-like domain-containing protein [Candidatus Angelobacter sp.]|jgi:hypothetical protein|nr:Ig-like domain-containing protein [Candidatus Angelobacter sp.]
MTVKFRLPVRRPGGRGLGFWTRAGLATTGAAAVAGGALIGATGHNPAAQAGASRPAHVATPHVALASALLNQYWLVASDGGLWPFGGAGGFGSEGGTRLNQPIVGMAGTPTGQGYWFVASDGGIFPHGDAVGLGSTGNIHLNQPIVGMAVTPSGLGYMLVAADGGLFPFGDAPQGLGSTGGQHLNKPIVGMALTPDNGGYWLVASDGGIFPFGDAPGLGSTGGMRLNQPIVGMATTPTGKGYMLVASDGGLFPFGDAPQGLGSTGGMRLNQPIVGMALTPDNRGYWLVASDGGIFPFGDAQGSGSLGGQHLNKPIVGMAVPRSLIGTQELLSAASSVLPADGVTSTVLTATMQDSTGTPVPGDALTFTLSGPACGTISPTSAVTDAAGRATLSYRASTVLGTCTVHAAERFGSVSNQKTLTQAAGAASSIIGTPSTNAQYTADQGNAGIPATFTVKDAQGHTAPNVSLDLSTTLANASIPPTGTTNGSGVFSFNIVDTTAGDTGTVTATVHGTTVHGSTGTLTITPGAFHALGPPSVGSQVAGTQYTVPVQAFDAEGNAVNPDTTGFTFSGTALANPTSNGPTPTPVFEGPFSNGSAILDVTSLVAGSARQLTITDGAVSNHTNSYTVAAATTASVTGTPSTNAQYTANQGAAGIALTFTALDTYGNPVPGVVLALSQSGLGHATLPAPVTTGDGTAGSTLGVAPATITDTNATDVGTVTATVQGGTVHGSTAQITITPGALASLTLATPATQAAGTQYSTTLNAKDAYANGVNLAGGAVTITGTALSTAPDGVHSGQSSVGAFSAGQATVTVTSYNALTSAGLTASDNGIQGSTAGYTITAGPYTQLVATSGAFVTSDLGPTLFFQDPTGTPAASVSLTAKDAYGNTELANADHVNVTLAPDGAVSNESSDGGTLTGATTSGPDTAGSVLTTVTLASGTGSFTYTAPTGVSVPTSGNGKITLSDLTATPAGAVPYSPAITYATVTKVHSVNVNVASASFTADAGNSGIGVTSFASDGTGTLLGSVPIDFSTTGLTGPPTFSPSSPVLTTPSLPGPTGPASTTMHATRVGSGNVVATLRGAPLATVNLHATSPTVTVTVGAFANLAISAPNPASPTAGQSYTMTVTATDAEANPTTPGGATYSDSGTALDAAPNNGSTVGTAVVGSFTPATGQATLTGVAYKARAGATLQIGYGTVNSNTATFNVGSAAPSVATAAVPVCCDADTGNNGVVLTVTAADQYGNPITSQLMDITTTTLSSSIDTIDTIATTPKTHIVAFNPTHAAQMTTDATGTAQATFYDTLAGDTGKITATVHLTSVKGQTGTILITPGALHTLQLSNPSSPQVAGTAYTVTVTATDAYGNTVNPTTGTNCTNSGTVTCSGAALDTAPDGTTAGHASFTSGFSGGTATLSVTSFKAEPNVTLTVSSGGVNGSTNPYTVNAAGGSLYGVTSANADYNATSHTVHPSSNSEIVSFTITVLDQWHNVAADHQTDVIHVLLTAGAPPDGGTLTGGGHTTTSDTTTPQSVDVTLSGGTGTFSYQAAATRVATSTGTISFSDTTSGALSPTPTTISIQN